MEEWELRLEAGGLQGREAHVWDPGALGAILCLLKPDCARASGSGRVVTKGKLRGQVARVCGSSPLAGDDVGDCRGDWNAATSYRGGRAVSVRQPRVPGGGVDGPVMASGGRGELECVGEALTEEVTPPSRCQRLRVLDLATRKRGKSEPLWWFGTRDLPPNIYILFHL
ncbi:hypothetical protein C8R44DRAFT_747046 [Mycena epipterygia]|nr:hypothetical protein C8R44DRAFT_747046 [Mycena epipterygia]